MPPRLLRQEIFAPRARRSSTTKGSAFPTPAGEGEEKREGGVSEGELKD